MKHVIKGALVAVALSTMSVSAAEGDKPAAAAAPGAQTAKPVATGPITGILSVRNGGSESDVATTVIHDLRTREQCLAVAWVASVRNNDTWLHKEANIACLQGETVVAAQSCVNGNCTPLEP
jgi:hypothetical protein